MFLYYEVRGLDVTLINTCETFEPLYKQARQKALTLLEPESRKVYDRELPKISTNYSQITHGRHSMLIRLEAQEFKYETDNYYLHVKELPSRLKNEEYVLFNLTNELRVNDISNDFMKLYEKAVDMTLEDLEEFSSEENLDDYEYFFRENEGKEVFDYDSNNDGVYVNFKRKYYQYWTTESEDYLIIIDKLPKTHKRVVL